MRNALLRTEGSSVPLVDRRKQFLDLARERLAAPAEPLHWPAALLQQIVNTTHASTLACALAHKDAGAGKFDNLRSS